MEKLPLIKRIQPHLDDLRDRKVTGRSVARLLGVTETHLSRTLKRLGIEKVKTTSRQENRRLREARDEYRKTLATTLPLKEAAAAARCHPRTLQRLLQKA
jgi:transcriptional regulator GlxA family with amidase domain